MALWDLLVFATVAGSVLLLVLGRLIAFPALVASGLAALRTFDVLELDVEGVSISALLATVIAATGAIAYFANAEKHAAAVGAVLGTVGGVQLIFVLELV